MVRIFFSLLSFSSFFFLVGCSLPAPLTQSSTGHDHAHTAEEMAHSDHHDMDHSMDHGSHDMMHHDHSSVTSEQQFIVDMIPHHQEAVDTSKIVLSQTTNTGLQLLLSGIISTQTQEIDMMKGRLTQRYTGTTMTSTYQNMMPDLTKLTGTAQEKAYLEGMIAHHQGAVQMAQSVLKLNPRSEVKQFAETIIAVQQAEIAMMTLMLKNLKY